MRLLPSFLAACASLAPVAAQESPPPVGFRSAPPKPATQPKAEQPEAKNPAAKPTPRRSRLVFGQVVDQDGNPVAGVGLTLGSLKTLVTDLCLTKPLARTDAEGRFEFVLAPPKIEPAPKPPKATDPKAGEKNKQDEAKIGSEADRAAKEVLAEALAQVLVDGIGDDQTADVVAGGIARLAATAAKKAVPSGKEAEQARRAYLQVCGEGWSALRVKMPAINYAVVSKWKEPKTDKEKIAQAGLNILARVWGAAARRPRDGVDVKKLVVHRGVMVSGRVVDDAGKPVVGARLTATDLMTAGRFRGVDSASRRNCVSYATSADDGTFRLPGLFSTGSKLTVTAEGCIGIQRPVVGASELLLTLRRSALVEGRIVNQDGKPADAKIEVRFESTSSKQSVTLEKDGAFHFHPKHPNRLRLYITPKGESAKEHGPTYSEILTGRQKELVITLEKKKPKPKPKTKSKEKPRLSRFARAAKIGFAVSVIDSLTGRPLRDFKAGSVWKGENYAGKRGYYEGRISSVGKKSKQPGYIRVPGPKTTSTPKGAVIVQAPGYAIFTKLNLEFDPASPASIVAAMVPESILGGVVRDGATGKTIHNARVYLYRIDEHGNTERSMNTRTDTSGRFVFKNLSAGRYRCRAQHNSRSANQSPFRLAAEEKRCDLAFELGAALTIRGVITGAKPGKGWRVQLLSESNMMSIRYNPTYRPSGTLVDLQDGGRFEFKGISPGYYEVCLQVPRPSQPKYPMQIPVEPIRVRKHDMTLEIDVSEDLPGRLVGEIGFGGVKLDFARLMVVVAPYVAANSYNYWSYGNIDITGARCQVNSGGTFTVDVKSGEQRVRVFDLITGVQLFQSELPIRVKPGREKKVPIELALTEVHVKLKPTTEGGLINASWLNLHVQQAQPEALRMFGFFSSSSGKRATGVSLLGANGEIKLVLPALKTKFEIYTEVARLARTKHKPNNRVGDAELTPKLGEINVIEIEVDVPQTGFDPVPKEPEEKDETPKKAANKSAKKEVAK